MGRMGKRIVDYMVALWGCNGTLLGGRLMRAVGLPWDTLGGDACSLDWSMTSQVREESPLDWSMTSQVREKASLDWSMTSQVRFSLHLTGH